MRTVTELLAEDVQAYPRPPALDRIVLPVEVILGGEMVARTTRALRVCETHHAPTYYIPPEDIAPGALSEAAGSSYCEWKGSARYWTVAAGGQTRRHAAWSYPSPTPAFAALKDHMAFYPGLMEACRVGGVDVTPQPGDFYGGWVTPNLLGTVKGAPETRWW
ncbi:MAG: DUF427 domain-containing protein [Pseudomonadota bacterium]